jgi:5-methylcytosine-specific restriction enzyme A
MPWAPKTRRPLRSGIKKRENRPNANARGYGRRWQVYSQNFLRLNPFCRPCESAGRVTAAEATDHVQPVNGPDDPLFWVASNHQPICWRCHSSKTARENQK